jgi:hypothetical protein
MSSGKIAEKLVKKCIKYDKGQHTVESCFPKTMSSIKKLFEILKDCEDDNECDVESAGFDRSFLLAILESDVALNSDLDDYLTNILNLPLEVQQNKETGYLETNTKKRVDGMIDKQFAEYYLKYHNILDKINDYLLLDDAEVKKLSIAELRNVLEEYLEVVIAFCLYVNSVDEIKENFKLGCKNLNKLKKLQHK